MDIIYKLRIIFWTFVLIIWGIYLYQYISEDIEKEKSTKIILNTSEKRKLPIKLQKKNQENFQSENKELTPTQIPKEKERVLIASGTHITDIFVHDEHYKYEETINTKVEEKKEYHKISEIPKGFIYKETRHFHLFVEEGINADEIAKKIEELHGDIMLDLISFSPWTRDEKVSVYLARSVIKYQEISKRPAWSGGAANLKERKIYLYESDEWYSILAHELTHIYFDSFFGGYDKSPLWLSEGMAVYIQVKAGKKYPNWLKEYIIKLREGSYYQLSDLIKIKTLDDADEKSVKLWYAQSFSVVYFLITIQKGDSFYQFCKKIKEGHTVSRALLEAYGKPYTSVASLESVWKVDIKTGNITGDIFKLTN
jgi:hypothetical protein